MIKPVSTGQLDLLFAMYPHYTLKEHNSPGDDKSFIFVQRTGFGKARNRNTFNSCNDMGWLKHEGEGEFTLSDTGKKVVEDLKRLRDRVVK